MAGRIKDDDIAEVREKARIDEVIGDYVSLRNAGGGSLKGLCPFHDEKSPSFNVTPARQFFHCFGCGEGGDVFSFLMKVDGIGFSEAIERLADKYGVQLRREDGPAEPRGPRGPQRSRLLEAHQVAEAFYVAALSSPDGVAARQFLDGRGFDRGAAEMFGVGFSPRDGEAVSKHLRNAGFTEEEMVASGISAKGNRGVYDRFRGRVMWPIREASGHTIGFGARRLFDDDRIEAKYLNTSETTIYKKSHVLYGLDLARQAIKETGQAVIVEGYTDVMACHLAGVPTAVATCGTAFGDDHARVLRRFLHDHDESRGEVIFTFDGDQAGQNAAMKVFRSDQNFASQTYVAVAPDGLDPCDLRIQRGDEAVRELVENRRPLYRFALENVLARFDLERADGRVDALREAATMVSSVRDKSKVEAFSREIAQMVGVDVDEARREVRRAASRPARGNMSARQQGRPATPGPSGQPPQPGTQQSAQAPQQPAAPPLPHLRDPRFSIERATLKLVLHQPELVATAARDLQPDDFTHPTYRGVWDAIAASGGPQAAGVGWAARLRDTATDPTVSAVLTELSVEPLMIAKEPDLAYAHAHVFKLMELSASRRLTDVKSRLQRTDPVEQADDYQRLFAELMTLEQRRRHLRDRAMGAQ